MERRKKGYGYIEKSKSGDSWVCKIPVGKLPSGRTKYKTKGCFPTYEEANAWAKQFIEEHGTIVDKPENFLTFDEMLQKYLDYKKTCINSNAPDRNPIKQRTYDSIEDTVRVYFRLQPSPQNRNVQKYHSNNPLAKKFAVEITESLVKEFLTDLIKQGMSRSCVKKCYDTIKNTFSMYPEFPNPCNFKFFYNKNYHQAPPVYFTDDEIEKICSYLMNHPNVEIAGPAIQMLAYTGLRVGELCGIRFSDYSVKKNELHIQRNVVYSRSENKRIEETPKTNRSNRVIVLCEKAKEAIFLAMKMNQHLAESNGYIFATKTGNTIDSSNLHRTLKGAMKQLGIPRQHNKGLHAFRHSFVSRILSESPEIGIEQVALYVGHSSSAITSKIYSHAIDTSAARAIVNAIDKRAKT